MADKELTTSITVKENQIRVMRVGEVDYISLTDLAKYSNPEKPSDVIIHWLSNKSTFHYIGLWERINNPSFNFAGFREIKIEEVGKYSFTMSPRRWVKTTNAIGIVSKGGRAGLGTFAHPDIAFEFASWLSPEFKLYLIREFERLKRNEQYQQKLEWHANRLLAKANYLIQTEAIKEMIVPTVTEKQKRFVYAEEADLLHLIILNNMENINAQLIKNGLSQSERLVQLNEVAKSQVRILINNKSIGDILKLK